ncbi:MAG TPA: DUF6625 family protein [Puia sp.]|nr:DUF6625 family protein [Puia sp.]
MKQKKEIAMILPYFGKFPWYFPFFLQSCRYNPNVDFFIISDHQYDSPLPENVIVIRQSFADLTKWIGSKLGFEVNIPYPYKLCDFKPTYGLVFSELIRGYKFWGHGDIDVIYGKITDFITDKVLNTHDIISIRHDYLTGYFLLYRNNCKMNLLFKQSKDYKKVFTCAQHFCFDETNFTWSLFNSGVTYDKIYCEIESMTHVVYKMKKLKSVKPYFDFHVISGRGNIRWEKGVLWFSEEGKEYEILLYHLIDFKHVYHPKGLPKIIPEMFFFDQDRIYYSQVK